MDILGISLGEWFAILFIGLGPARVTLAYIPLSRPLVPELQRALAVRTVWVGAIVAATVLLLGGAVARTLAVRADVLLVAAGLAFGSQAFAMLRTKPTDAEEPSRITDPMRLALSPLAVPVMISPVGVVALFSVAMAVPGAAEGVVFFGLVVAVLGLNLGSMLLSRRLARRVTRAVLELIQQVFAILILALSIVLVLNGLEGLGLISISGSL